MPNINLAFSLFLMNIDSVIFKDRLYHTVLYLF